MNKLEAALLLGPATTSEPDPTTHVLNTKATATIPAARITFNGDGSGVNSCQFNVENMAGTNPITSASSWSTNFSGNESCNDSNLDGISTDINHPSSLTNFFYLINNGSSGKVNLNDITSTKTISAVCNTIVNNHTCGDLKFVTRDLVTTYTMLDSSSDIIDHLNATTTHKSYGTIQSIKFLDPNGSNPILFVFNGSGNVQFDASFNPGFGAYTNSTYDKVYNNQIVFKMQPNQRGDIVFGSGVGVCPAGGSCTTLPVCPAGGSCTTLPANQSNGLSHGESQNGIFNILVDYLNDPNTGGNYLKTSLDNVTVGIGI